MRRTTPAIRAGVIPVGDRPRTPSLSRIRETISCVQTVAATTPPAPNSRTVTSEIPTIAAPATPPIAYSARNSDSPLNCPRPPVATSSTPRIPSDSETLTNAAPKEPTCLPSSEFAGGWAATRAPATSVAAMAKARSMCLLGSDERDRNLRERSLVRTQPPHRQDRLLERLPGFRARRRLLAANPVPRRFWLLGLFVRQVSVAPADDERLK